MKMELLKLAMEGLKDEEMDPPENRSSRLENGVYFTGKLISEAKHQSRDLPGNKEGSTFDSDSSSSSEKGSHNQGEVAVLPELQERPEETKIDIIEVIEGRLEDFDVERILGTHDLCCPNCGSSTTVRSILRKKAGTLVVPPPLLPPPVPRRRPLAGPLDEQEEPLLPPSTDRGDGPGEALGCLQCLELYINRCRSYLGQLWSSGRQEVGGKQDEVVMAPELQEPPKETKIDFVELIEGRLEDFDGERTLGTHDFYCPRCRASATVGVVLRKRPGTPVGPPPNFWFSIFELGPKAAESPPLLQACTGVAVSNDRNEAFYWPRGETKPSTSSDDSPKGSCIPWPKK